MSVFNSIGATLKGRTGASPGGKPYWPVLIYATLMAMALRWFRSSGWY